MAEKTNNTHTDAGKETLQDLTNRKQTRIYTPKWHWYTHRGWTDINKDAFAVKHARKKNKKWKISRTWLKYRTFKNWYNETIPITGIMYSQNVYIVKMFLKNGKWILWHHYLYKRRTNLNAISIEIYPSRVV